MKKYLRLTLIFLAALTALTACGTGGGNTATTTVPLTSGDATGEEPTGTTAGTTTSPAPVTTVPQVTTAAPEPTTTAKTTKIADPLPGRVTISSAKKSGYQIVYSGSFTSTQIAFVKDFAAAFETASGVSIPVVSEADASVRKAEIVVNATTKRSDAAEFMKQSSYTGYEIRLSGERILVSAYNDANLQKALTVLLTAITQDNLDIWSIPGSFYVLHDDGAGAGVPKFKTANGILQNGSVYYCSAGNYMAGFEKTTLSEYSAYVKSLISAGFEQVDTNRIADNQFASFHKEGAIVELAFYPAIKTTKISICQDGYQPTGKKSTVTKTVKPSVTIMDNAANSFVFQLSDGSFIIVDGGHTNKTAHDKMYNFLKEKTPGDGKPVIALWMVSHAHNDHLEMANDFLNKYYDKVELRMVAYNFPDYENVGIVNEDLDGWGLRPYSRGFIEAVATHYPDAETWIMHSGQKNYIADAKIEVLFTHEDLYPQEMPWGNHTCSAWRITINGKTIVMLGDCEKTLCQQMADCYGDTLQSEMLQLSHHGLNGACLDLYQAVDPKICFWPNSQNAYETDSRCTTDYDFNVWIRTTKWTRGSVTGDRTHYAGSQKHTVYFE